VIFRNIPQVFGNLIYQSRQAFSYLPTVDRTIRDVKLAVPQVSEGKLKNAIGHFFHCWKTVRSQPVISELLKCIDDIRQQEGFRERSPVWVLSTGRAGTKALDGLLEKSGSVLSIHRNYALDHAPEERNEFFYHLLEGTHSNRHFYRLISGFLAKRLPELLRAYSSDRQLSVTFHSDVVFAPVVACAIPEAKFIYLNRNLADSFVSFYANRQYNNQLEPLYIDPDLAGPKVFNCLSPPWSEKEKIAWYMFTTEAIVHALFDRLDDGRKAELRSEDLFSAKREAIAILRDCYVIVNLSDEDIKDYFEVKHNEREGTRTLQASDRAVLEATFHKNLEYLSSRGTF